MSKILGATAHATPFVDCASIGTFAFKAPESYDKEFTYLCDIFSYGMMCYEIATRRPVFEGMTPNEISDSICNKKIRPNLSLVSDKAFATLIEQCWQHEPEARIQSFENIIDYIDDNMPEEVTIGNTVTINWKTAKLIAEGVYSKVYVADNTASTANSKVIVKEAKAAVPEALNQLKNENVETCCSA